MNLINKCKLSKTALFVFGFLLLFLSYIPMFLLGTDSFVYYHDQLDGELISYIYQAKYLFSGSNVIPEFMNGAAKTALIAPAPLAILPFRLFPPFAAYMLLFMLGQFCSYGGMFQLIYKMIGNQYIAFLTAILFAFLPFLPVYGLAQYGVPLLLYSFWLLYERKHMLPAFLYIALYTLLSSPVLIGFVWILLGLGLLCYFAFTKRVGKQKVLLSSFGMMFVLYVVVNINLLLQMLGVGNTYVSHKVEYVLTPVPFFRHTLSYLTSNTSHSTDYHSVILVFVIIVLLPTLLLYKKLQPETRKCAKQLLLIFSTICLLCMLAALWETNFVVQIREHFGALKTFQFTRVLWITPTLWYIVLALCMNMFLQEKRIWRTLQYGVSFIVLGLLSIQCLKGSFLKPNLQKLFIDDYKIISWSDYFALGVMEQVEDYLHTNQGLEKSDYTVVSLGIDPVAALYHGFYCIDGYSNNYDLEHKHAFREIIAPELAKNEYLQITFDNWGNRCYLFTSEIPGYYNIEKNSAWYNQLNINTDALRNMGCDYILSAAYIVNSEELDLTLLREEPFVTDTSYYQIYLYQVNP